MPLDKDIRNRLHGFVTDARELLTDEFTRQLQQDYGMDPKAGSVADVSSLTHLDDMRLETAQLLRDIQAHYLAGIQGSSSIKVQKDVLTRIAREQAFTVLNRLAALRMMEARGLLQESIAHGYQSNGFELYALLAGPALGEKGDAYRCYLFSVFDEFAADLPQMFDRYSPQGRLFPRDTALLELLALINDPELELLWAEDETIGWIYQYFNSKEERKEMRKAAAPRNSRELAVRNQFFTPRYVVEFLVDNSLGRAWFDWTGGKTELYDRCQYLLRKPDDAPEMEETTLRDPRGIKLLDPACGSMHFGLYAFDLFEIMYGEAWGWEEANGLGSLTGDGAFPSLQESYVDKDALLRDVPRLIIEHNIYGVDIDSRATQIASLALWLRAQRSWHDAGIKAKDRPAVGKGHVIAAVAPPAEPELREQMAASLDTNDAKLFEETLRLLKGLPELGVLLRMEQEIPHLIRTIYGDAGDMFAEEDMERWEQAESRLRNALEGFIKAAQATYQGRLFAHDALEGLRLMDLVRETFDVVVMNPPFGALSVGVKKDLVKAYPRSKNDLLAIFVERGLELLRTGGRIGAITSRTAFFLSSYQKWREEIVLGIAEPEVFADLGHGVMDDAMVEAAAYVLEKQV
ncbi:BREX-1 system adenine-specific DNA-methyltransferase PglX [Gammaproteobacteria bacterium]|nr:BREX-1 system adenine-specific DNA-methyltransferase PglX [Gammaproteobacteria bacterium]